MWHEMISSHSMNSMSTSQYTDTPTKKWPSGHIATEVTSECCVLLPCCYNSTLPDRDPQSPLHCNMVACVSEYTAFRGHCSQNQLRNIHDEKKNYNLELSADSTHIKFSSLFLLSSYAPRVAGLRKCPYPLQCTGARTGKNIRISLLCGGLCPLSFSNLISHSSD